MLAVWYAILLLALPGASGGLPLRLLALATVAASWSLHASAGALSGLIGTGALRWFVRSGWLGGRVLGGEGSRAISASSSAPRITMYAESRKPGEDRDDDPQREPSTRSVLA